MDTEKTLDLNKPLFSYSRYERNEYGYGDDFIHRDGDAVAKTFYALSGESFDSYLMTASEVCKKTLGMLEPEPPQPAKTKNLSQKTMSSREASTRLSDEIGVKPCTHDEGTVGDS